MKKRLINLSLILTGVFVLAGCYRSIDVPAKEIEKIPTPQEVRPNGIILNEEEVIPENLLTEGKKVDPTQIIGELTNEAKNEMQSTSGELEIFIETQSLKQDIFLTKTNSQSPTGTEFEKLKKGTVIKYLLVLHSKIDNQKVVIDTYESRGGMPEINPFGLIGFEKNDEYFEYYIPFANSALFKMYDVIHQRDTKIRPSGYIDQRFWHKDYYIMCSHLALDGMEAGITVVKPPYFELDDQYFIYPEELNQVEEDRIRYLTEHFPDKSERNPKNCRIEENELIYETDKEHRFDLDQLDQIKFPKDQITTEDK